MHLAIPANHKIKLKEKKEKKRDKYLYFTRELWNMKMTGIPTIIGALGTVTKGFIQGREDLEIRGRVETIQTTALLRSASIMSPGDLLSLKFFLETISLLWCEKLSIG